MRFLLIVLLVVSLAVVPVSSSSINITFFSDSGCSQQMGRTITVTPCTSPAPCTTLPGGIGSHYYLCDRTGGYNNITVKLFSKSSTCSGAPDVMYDSYGKEDTCAVMYFAYNSPVTTVYANIAWANNKTATADTDMTALLTTTAEHAANRSGRMGAKLGLDRLFARKQAQ